MSSVHLAIFAACESRSSELKGQKHGGTSYKIEGDTSRLDRALRKLKAK
jgi:hypothetical protein